MIENDTNKSIRSIAKDLEVSEYYQADEFMNSV